MDTFVLPPPPSDQQPWNPAPMPTAADPFGERTKTAAQPAMSIATEALGQRISDLETATAELVARIKPVLLPVVPQVSAQQPTPAPPPKALQSPLCDRIEMLSRAVESIARTVKDAIKRVEV